MASPHNELKSTDVEKYAGMALRSENKSLIVMLANAVSKSTDLLCLPEFLKQPIPNQALISCLDKVAFSEENVASILLYLVKQPPTEWPNGLTAIVAKTLIVFHTLHSRKSTLLARWKAILRELNDSEEKLATLIKQDMKSMIELVCKMKSETNSVGLTQKVKTEIELFLIAPLVRELGNRDVQSKQNPHVFNLQKELMKFIQSSSRLLDAQ